MTTTPRMVGTTAAFCDPELDATSNDVGRALKRSLGIALLWAVAPVLAAALVVVTPVIGGTDEAFAACSGSTPVVKVAVFGGTTVARDDPNSGTCDGDAFYGFRFTDGPATDGRCSYIDFGTSPNLSRYTCGSVSTWYDDQNSGYISRFRRTTGAGSQATAWFGGNGH